MPDWLGAAEVLLPSAVGRSLENGCKVTFPCLETVNLPAMAADAERLFNMFLDQWKTGQNGELRLLCESGNLKVNFSADFGPWRAQPVIWPKVWGSRGVPTTSPSRLKRRERRAAERAAAEKLAAESAAAESAAAENTAAKRVAAERVAAEKLAVEKAATEKIASAEKAADKVCESEMTATTSCSHSKVQCWNCNGDMTPDHQCGVLASVPPEHESVVEEHPPPLPLCHYCCHLGSGSNPVHYYLQCLCAEKVCSCQCYCTEKQQELKREFFPSGFSGKSCVDVNDRPRARAIAEARANKLDYRGVPMGQRPCEDKNCVLDAK